MNEIEIRRFLELMHPAEDALIEVRIIEDSRTYSGYFKSKELLIEKLSKLNPKANIYFTLNEIEDACYSRSQMNEIISNKKITTTSDANITQRNWLFIDLDAKRPSDVSSTESEMQHTIIAARKIFKYMRNIGFYDPIVCMSGNGAYLLYKINLPNTDECKDLIKKCLQVLDMWFSSEFVDIDCSVFNSARIAKIIGTVARKGSNTTERPHRLSKILSVPQNIRINEKPILESLAANLPEKEKPTYENNYGRSQFDLDSFISQYGIRIHKEQTTKDGKKYLLEECPFCGHKSPDSAIFKTPEGLGFKCFHNSCSNKRWEDFRKLYEPNYKDKQSNYYSGDNRIVNKQDRYNNQQQITKENKPKESLSDEKGNVWLKASEIKLENRADLITMPTRILKLDEQIIGLNLGETTVVSGLNSSGKTSLLSQVCLNFVDQGFNGAIWSGEMRNSRLQNWIHLQAAGRTWNQKAPTKNYYYTPDNARKQIDKWLDDKMYIYNDKYSNDFNWIEEQINILTNEKDISWILLDNLMALDLSRGNDNEFAKQTEFILRLVDLGKKKNTHMILVAHPRKSTTFLRKEDIGGSGNISNAVDNVLVVHRVNRDFEKRSSEFYEKSQIVDIIDRGYGNVVECCKNRDLGNQDFIAGLFYEHESKRFLNDRHENFTYNWVDYELDKQLAERESQKSKDIILPNNSFDIEPPKVNDIHFEYEFKNEDILDYLPKDRNAFTSDLPF